MAFEPNDVISKATETGINFDNPTSYSNSDRIGNNTNIARELDVDLYKIQADPGDRIAANVNAKALNSFLILFNSAGNQQPITGASLGFPDSDAFFSFNVTTSDTYYIGVSGLPNGSYNPFVEGSGFGAVENIGDYNINILVAAPQTITGTTRNDVLSGGKGNDTISGLAGNDTLRGAAGDDFLRGDTGNDNLFGGANSDTILGGAGNDNIIGGNNINKTDFGDSLRGQDGNDRITGSNEFDRLNGGNGNDLLTGGDRFDNLDGGAGNDTLIGVSTTELGRSDRDTLTGGTGADIFVLGNARGVFYYQNGEAFDEPFASSSALIADFNVNQDFIKLRGSVDRYNLDFITSEGVTNAEITYDPGISGVEDPIAIISNVSTDFSLTASYISYV
jgi:Ca2+-binding RTX toxin-like protein